MTKPAGEKEPDTAIEAVERLREQRFGRGEATEPGWSLTGWRSVDWLLLALVLSFVLYVLLPHF